MKQDLQIFNLIKKEEERQTTGIELIASENYVSKQVLAALGSVCTNKYAEGYPGARYYGGCEVVDQIEQLAINRVCELFEAEYANVQPHSGAQANMAVMMACLKPGDTFMGLDLAHGGHLTHGSPVNMSGILYHAVSYGLDEVTGLIDYSDMEKKALEHRPKLIIGGASAYSREWDWERMRRIADSVGAIFMVDMAHTAGLIAAGLLVIIVLYNLTNINICERRKEIATLKVLGYRRREVSGYVFREIMVLVIFGVIFGIGIKSKAAVVFCSAVVPCILNSYTGIKQSKEVHMWVARTFGATRLQMLWTVAIPTALPHIMTGIRVALSSAWVAIVAAELLGSTKGLGFMIQQSRGIYRTDIIIVGMLAIGICGIILSIILSFIEHLVVKGRK